MPMKAEGGMLELVDSYGRLIFILLVIIVLIVIFITYIASHPELGVSIPPLFSGEGGG